MRCSDDEVLAILELDPIVPSDNRRAVAMAEAFYLFAALPGTIPLLIPIRGR